MRDGKLGFTFYPKDWWTSDSFYALQPFERYIYLELLFMMYVNDGFVQDNRLNVERRLATVIKDEIWTKVTDLMIKDGDQLTHKSVNKRLRKTLANRENGKAGGRPRKAPEDEFADEIEHEEKPKKPKSETQKNPPLEKKEKENRNIIEDEGNGSQAPTHPPELIESYKKFNDWLKENAPRVLQLKKQITIDQYLKLKTAYPDGKIPRDVLKRMDNYKPLTSKYVDAYQTLKNWIKLDERK